MHDDNAMPPSWLARFLACGYYAGLAPFFAFARRAPSSPFLAHHRRQAMGVFLLLQLVGCAFLLAVLLLSYGMIYQRAFYDWAHPEGRTLNVVWKFFLCWVVFWAYCVALALFGSRLELPVVSALGRRKRLAQGGALFLLAAYAVLGVAVPVGIHAASLVRQDAAPGQVYLLYEDVDRFPRWLFALGFYRISLAANERWGHGSVVALRLSEDSLRRTLKEGRFAFIGSHGMKQGLLLKGGRFIRPEDIRRMGVNPELKFVYLTSCDSGAQKDAWEKVFAPATVVTYDRLTAVLEHVWWLWFRAPGLIRSLPA